MSRFKILYKHQWANITMAVVGALLFVSIFSSMSFHIEAMQFSLSLELFDHGMTEIVIPPVGKITAKTHDTPLKIRASLENIDMDLLRRLVDLNLEQKSLVPKLKQEMLRVLKIYVLRILLLSSLGGMFGIFLLRRNRPVTYLRGALTGLVLMGLLLTGTYASYNTNSFLTPKYEGIIQTAPWMVNFAQKAFGKIEKLGDRMQETADNLYQLYEKVDALDTQAAKDENTFNILHVSDIHNNPAAYDFIQQVVENFKVDAIVDTGDLSDFGSPLETKLLSRLKSIKIPYIIVVSGNHDSPEIVKALKEIKNVTVLEGTVTNVSGLRVLGIGDPAAVSSNITPPNPELAQKYIQRLEEALNKFKPVDILMVHNPGIAENFAGKVPTILHGHDHQLKIRNKKGSNIIDAGTSGAAGIRGLYASKEVPYSVVLLRFKKANNKISLVAADTIKVFNLRTGFQLERIVFPKTP